MENGTTDDDEYTFQTTAIWLWRVVSPIFIIFGTFGNVMTIVILSRKTTRINSTSVYLSALAVSDLIALNTGLLRQWITYTFDVDVRTDLTVTGCKLHFFVVYVATQFSSWMLVCMTADRFHSTWLPHRRAVACNTRTAFVAVGVIASFLFLLNFHYLAGYGTLETRPGNVTVESKCVPLTEQYDNFIKFQWPWIDLCVFYLAPLFVLVSGNSAIVYKVIKSHHNSRRVAPVPTLNQISTLSVEPSRTQSVSKTSSLTTTLLIVSVVFIVCITPIVVYPVGQPHWENGASREKMSELFFWETLANLFMYANHAINFVLYFLSGSKFREETKKILCKTCTQYGINGQSSRSASIFPRSI